MTRQKYGLLGCPLAHSLSVSVHEALLRLKGRESAYALYEIPREAFEAEAPRRLRSLNGCNVTAPYKEAVIPFLDELCGDAALYGAVNTVENRGGTLLGHNTDGIGFMQSLALAGETLGGRVLICGCGGAARTFAFEALRAGAQVTLGIRRESAEKALRLQEDIRAKLSADCGITLLGDAGGDYDIVINATPLGAPPAGQDCPAEDGVLRGARLVYDAVYRPSRTLLLRKADALGIRGMNGLAMLVCQAAAAEECWHGISYSPAEINQVIALVEKETEDE